MNHQRLSDSALIDMQLNQTVIEVYHARALCRLPLDSKQLFAAICLDLRIDTAIPANNAKAFL